MQSCEQDSLNHQCAHEYIQQFHWMLHYRIERNKRNDAKETFGHPLTRSIEHFHRLDAHTDKHIQQQTRIEMIHSNQIEHWKNECNNNNTQIAHHKQRKFSLSLFLSFFSFTLFALYFRHWHTHWIHVQYVRLCAQRFAFRLSLKSVQFMAMSSVSIKHLLETVACYVQLLSKYLQQYGNINLF